MIAGLVWWSGIPLSSASVPPGEVTLEAEARGATLEVVSLLPGEEISQQLSISNGASVRSKLAMAETAAPSEVSDGALRLRIERDDVEVYDGQFGAMADFWAEQGWIDAGGYVEYTFTVSLPPDADPVTEGSQVASAVYTWETDP